MPPGWVSRRGLYIVGSGATLNSTLRTNLANRDGTTPSPEWNAESRKHYRACLRLRRRAENLYAERELEAAAELLYMAAKRAINAVANSHSENPISTRAKFRQLKLIAQAETDGEQLLDLWNAAWRLHTYADQMPETAILEQDWQSASEFIDRMLALMPDSNELDTIA